MILKHIDEESCLRGDADGLLPAAKGSYALLLRLDEAARIRVGALGDWPFAAGYYLYLGSALGPGGLAARLRRHLSREKRPFWHVDYLRGRAAVAGIWYVTGPARREHAWAAAATRLPGAGIPVPRFGASDCRCPGHLVYFQERPSSHTFPVLLEESRDLAVRGLV
jgi:Uri superfamily endonuclease